MTKNRAVVLLLSLLLCIVTLRTKELRATNSSISTIADSFDFPLGAPDGAGYGTNGTGHQYDQHPFEGALEND